MGLASLAKALLSVGLIGTVLWRTDFGAKVAEVFERFAKHHEVDMEDCYFDKACHRNVDWAWVYHSKLAFLELLTGLKETSDLVGVWPLVSRTHGLMVKAGVPSDRSEYMLTKWLESTYPDAVQELFSTSDIVVRGFSCGNGYGGDINQAYKFMGSTKDGRPYYQGMANPSRYIYYDTYCADDTREQRWLLGQKPDLTRDFDLNQFDSPGCNNDFSIVTRSMHLPGGWQPLAWQWCGTHGIRGNKISISYALSSMTSEVTTHKIQKQPFADRCARYSLKGPIAVRACQACSGMYPSVIDGCMTCDKQCWKKTCTSRPSDPQGCDKTLEHMVCHKKCMDLRHGEIVPAVQKKKNEQAIDTKDCYFDKECHDKVDWEKIGSVKEGFYARLKHLNMSADHEGIKALMQRTRAMERRARLLSIRRIAISTRSVTTRLIGRRSAP
eukprot:TRINITY_DN3122_c0_g1_i10.p1 TRINITY_DN3122_c0_g1~~TRINITY_DN3122_c0_g1_i10.p1  ORF type:complete len:440 (+),score=58.64 TRINITY_DN3122_c0_g1_i10:236-1555(+)